MCVHKWRGQGFKNPEFWGHQARVTAQPWAASRLGLGLAAQGQVVSLPCPLCFARSAFVRLFVPLNLLWDEISSLFWVEKGMNILILFNIKWFGNGLHWWPLCGRGMLLGLNNPLYAYDFWALGMNSLLCHYDLLSFGIKILSLCACEWLLSWDECVSYMSWWLSWGMNSLYVRWFGELVEGW